MAAPPFGINHAEVGLYQAGLGQRIEKLAEILHRGTHFQRTPHYPSVSLSTLLTGFHLDQIIGLRIHNGEAPRRSYLSTHPSDCLPHCSQRLQKDSDPPEKYLTLFCGKSVSRFFHNKGTSVGGNLAGNYGRGTGGKRPGASQRYNGGNQGQ